MSQITHGFPILEREKELFKGHHNFGSMLCFLLVLGWNL